MRRYKIAEQSGRRIKAIRKRNKLSQEEVAARARIHVSTFGRIERGEINAPLQTINKIAQALGVKPKDLLP